MKLCCKDVRLEGAKHRSLWDSKRPIPSNKLEDCSKFRQFLKIIFYSLRMMTPPPEHVKNGVELLFDPDLESSCLYHTSLTFLTNFSFFFSPSVSHQSSLTIFSSHRVMLLTPLATVATHPGCHSVVTLSLCGLGFYPCCRQPLVRPLLSLLPPCPPSISTRSVWRRIWPRLRGVCLSCSWKLRLTSRRPWSFRANWCRRCRTVRATANASLPWKHSWKVCVDVVLIGMENYRK